MAKIYVSSTYLDLKDYREQVERVIRRMGHTDVAMEYYVAEDTRPTTKCVSDVASCDVYVGIFAWRYGWQPTDDNPDNLSITEMEFRQAEKTGKPCFVFLLSDDAPWPRKHMDKDVGKIETLRNTASAKHTADYFTTPDELARKVAEAIYKQIPVAVSIPEYNLSTYYEALRKRYNVLALEGLTPPQKEEYLQIQLRSVFVEQSVLEDAPPVELPKEVWEKLSREQEIHDKDLPSGITLEDVRKARESYYQKPSRLVLDALTDSRCQYTIILGDPGSGKSTLARYVMLSLIDPLLAGDKIQKAFDGYLPLLIELRTFAGLCDDGKCETPLEFLEHLGKTEGWGLTQTALHNHLKNDGRAVVIFDGLDEIFEPKMRETITNQIVGFTNAYPKARVIVTSRILGYRRKILSDAGFTHFTLQDLDEKQVEDFITKWYELAMSDRLDEAKERSERILKSFADQASIRQLAGNPMLLTIMAIIGKHQELPRERWKLYDHAASVLIQHWDVNKHLKDENLEADFIGEDDKKELLRRLAYRMQSGDGGLAGNYIHREGLQEEFESYLKERYSQTPDRAKIIADAMIQQFRERNFILSLYGANVFGFVHRAFLEYFCASAFVWKFEKTKELTIEQLKTEVYGKHWEDQSWHEVLCLICGMIDEKWAGEIIEARIDFDYKYKHIFPHPNSSFRKPKLSVYLLGEVTNLNLLHEVIQKFAQHKNWESRLDILAIIKKSSAHYSEALSLLKAFSTQDDSESVRRSAVELLAEYYRESPQTFLFLKELMLNSHYFDVRSAAVSALAEYYRENIQTLALLRECAKQDKDWQVQKTAVSAIIEYYYDDSRTLEFLRERVNQDDVNSTRKSALVAIIAHYCEDSQTLPLLKERAVQDGDGSIREIALVAIAEHYHEDSQTLPLLKERAVQDDDVSVKDAALTSIAKYYHEDAQVFLFLWNCAFKEDDSIRSISVSVLAEEYREKASVLSLLRQCAIQDPEEEVRVCALWALAEYYRENIETLSFLRERAMHDEYGGVRNAAVLALIKYYINETHTLPLLQGCVVEDNDWEVRKSALSALVEHFYEDAQTLSLLQERVLYDKDGVVRRYIMEYLVEHYRNDVSVLPLLQKLVVYDEDANVRFYTISALARYYLEDPKTLMLLHERVLQDKNGEVRRVAVSALAKHYNGDASALQFLQERVLQDKYGEVRCVAMLALMENYSENPQTLLLLKDRAVNDESPGPTFSKSPDGRRYVRNTAVELIVAHWTDHPDTLQLLHDRTENDPTPWVRELALSLILKYYRTNIQTLLLLQKCAVNDKSPKPDETKMRFAFWTHYVRDTAINAIAKYWSDHPGTLQLLRERAENDPTPWLRERCKELIEEIEGNKE